MKDFLNKIKRPLAIAALVLMAVFTVALVAYFMDRKMLGGVIELIVVISGGLGIPLSLMLIIINRDQIKKSEAEAEKNIGNDKQG